MIRRNLVFCGLLAAAGLIAPAHAQLGTAFSYQGELRFNGVIVEGTADFQFDLFAVAAGGTPLAATNVRNAVPVTRGVFAVELDFGAQFKDQPTFLEIRVRAPAGSGAFATLSPRVELLPTPNALFAARAADADSLDGTPGTSYVKKGEPNSVTGAMIQPNVVSSLDGVSNDAGNIDLIAGANVTITPNDAANTITITASSNAGTLDGLDSTAFLRSDTSDSFTSGTLGVAAGATLDVDGTLNMDGPVLVADGTVLNVQGSPATFTIGGANLELSLGDSAADATSVAGPITFNNGSITLADTTTMTVNDSNSNGSTSVTIGPSFGLLNLQLNAETTIDGQLQMDDSVFTINSLGPKRIRFENGSGGLENNFSYEPAQSAYTMADGLIALGPIKGGAQNLFSNNFNTFGNSDFPSSSSIIDGNDVWITDDLEIGGTAFIQNDVELGDAEGNQSISFFDGGSTSGALIEWDDVALTALSTCPVPGALGTGGIGPVDASFRFNITDNTNTGWAFTNGTDVEWAVNQTGDMTLDGVFSSNGGCDLAEAFFGPDDLEPGTVVRLDPSDTDSVTRTSSAKDSLAIGVVSTQPGVLLHGPHSDFYPLLREFRQVQAMARENPDDEALTRRNDELEAALDSFPKGNVAVALAGRVPVKVSGAVRPGDALTSSDIPGVAMALSEAGPSIGLAMEGSNGGLGTVIMLVQPGYRVPTGAGEDSPSAVADAPTRTSVDADAIIARLEQRIAALESGKTTAKRDREPRVAGPRVDAPREGAPRRGGDGSDNPSIDLIAGGGRDAGPSESWGDFDGDGLDDVIVLGNPTRLLKNLGTGRFQDVTASANLGASADGARLALWRDYDVDQRLDLLLVSADGTASLLRGLGNAAFEDVTQQLGLDLGQPIVAAEWVDYDLDGTVDLRVALGDGRILLHHGLGQGLFQEIELRAAGADRVTQVETENAALQSRVDALEAMVQALLAKESNR